MAEEVQEEERVEEESKTFTQDEVNRIVGREKAKFKDYADLKKKAKAYDELQEQSKTDLEKATERAERAEAELKRMEGERERAGWVADAAESSGVPATVLAHVSADSEDELKAIAAEIKDAMPKNSGVVVENDGEQKAREPHGTAADWMRSTLPGRYQH